MNNRLFFEEIKDRTRNQAKNNIKLWAKWGFFLLFLFLSIASFMSVIVMSAFKQTVSIDAFYEAQDITKSFLEIQGSGNADIKDPMRNIIPYYDYFDFAINNTEILNLIAVVLSILFLILSFLFLRIKIKK